MAVEVFIRRWGNSLGLVLPKEVVEKQHLKLNEKVLVEFVKEADVKKLFGTLDAKAGGQAFKDTVRKGWS